jgi:Protein of unknown function (DUF1579)
MDVPKPGDAHQKLAALIGEWAGEETLHPAPWDPAGGAASARVTNRWAVDGFAVLQEYEQSRNGQVTFRGHGVFWYDPRREEYVMHWWDSMAGTAGEYRGRFDGQRLTLGAPMPNGGQSRTTWLLTGPNAHDFLMEISPDGETWMPAMEGQYQRRRAAQPAKKRSASAKKKVTPAKKRAAPTKKSAAPAKKKPAPGKKKAAPAEKKAAAKGRARAARASGRTRR